MTNGKIGPRCTAEPHPDARPLLTADAAARVAGHRVPVRDWRCVREPHSPTEQHLAMPAGITGPSVRFTDPAEDTPPPAPTTADPDDVRRLIDLVQAPGTTAVHVNDGDELLLLLPNADDDAVQRSADALAELFPTVSFLILAGVTGAVVMPKRTPPTYHELVAKRDQLLDMGVDPADLAMPIRRLDDQA